MDGGFPSELRVLPGNVLKGSKAGKWKGTSRGADWFIDAYVGFPHPGSALCITAQT